METYLGDGLYASYDGYQIKLRASHGPEVFLDDDVLRAFMEFVTREGRVVLRSETSKSPEPPISNYQPWGEAWDDGRYEAE